MKRGRHNKHIMSQRTKSKISPEGDLHLARGAVRFSRRPRHLTNAVAGELPPAVACGTKFLK